MKLNEWDAWKLASTRSVGRLAHMRDGEIFIFPVNYIIDDEKVFIRTGEDSMVLSASRKPEGSFAFEVDDLIAWSKTGWSVLIQGQLTEVTKTDRLPHAMMHRLQPWAGGVREHVLRLDPHSISGRSITARPGAITVLTSAGGR